MFQKSVCSSLVYTISGKIRAVSAAQSDIASTKGFAALAFLVEAVRSVSTKGKKTHALNVMELWAFAFTRKQNELVKNVRSLMAHMCHQCVRASARVATRIASTVSAGLIVASAAQKPFAPIIGKNTHVSPAMGSVSVSTKGNVIPAFPAR